MPPHRIDVHHHILPPDYVAEVGHDLIGPISVARAMARCKGAWACIEGCETPVLSTGPGFRNPD